MKREIHCLIAAAGIAGALIAASDANATVIQFHADLNGPSESPPNASPAFGFARVIFDTSSNTMRVVVDFQGLTAGNTASHIHCCTAVPLTSTASVATVTPTFTGFPTGTTSGHYDHTFNLLSSSSWNLSPTALLALNGNNTAAAEAALIAGSEAGKAYLNVHSSNFPGGEIRGFLTEVPEPSPLSLLGLGLVALGLVPRRKPRRA